MREYLKKKRKELGLSQRDVASAIGLSTNYYCDIENGERQRDMKITTLVKSSNTLKIPVEKMLKNERAIQGLQFRLPIRNRRKLDLTPLIRDSKTGGIGAAYRKSRKEEKEKE